MERHWCDGESPPSPDPLKAKGGLDTPAPYVRQQRKSPTPAAGGETASEGVPTFHDAHSSDSGSLRNTKIQLRGEGSASVVFTTHSKEKRSPNQAWGMEEGIKIELQCVRNEEHRSSWNDGV